MKLVVLVMVALIAGFMWMAAKSNEVTDRSKEHCLKRGGVPVVIGRSYEVACFDPRAMR